MHRVLIKLVEKMWDEDCDHMYGALRTQQRILKVRKETELPKTWENPEEWYRFHYDIYIYIYRRGLVNSIPWDDESSKIMEKEAKASRVRDMLEIRVCRPQP